MKIKVKRSKESLSVQNYQKFLEDICRIYVAGDGEKLLNLIHTNFYNPTYEDIETFIIEISINGDWEKYGFNIFK